MPKKRIVLVALLVPMVILLAGCSTGGVFTAGNVTDVQLQRNNFKIIARDVVGEASAGYILGGTFSMGMATNTFALVRVAGTGQLYREAMEGLWKNIEGACGPIEGRKVALINVRFDAEALNLILYTQPKIMVRADVVEFTD
jgi:hypothetical protein